jgi:hypothetical protein
MNSHYCEIPTSFKKVAFCIFLLRYRIARLGVELYNRPPWIYALLGTALGLLGHQITTWKSPAASALGSTVPPFGATIYYDDILFWNIAALRGRATHQHPPREI